MAAGELIRCLIADDHTALRDGLTAILEREEDMTVVGAACDGREAVELFRLYRPQITLMDLRMPEMDGIEATLAIRKEYPQARIIIVSSYEDEEDVYQAMHAGVRGYLLKGATRQDLVQAIRLVNQGQIALPPELTVLLVQHMNGDELTSRERQVLSRMARGQSNQEIACELLIAECTVKTHVNNIFCKLGVSDRTQAVVTALQRGVVRLQ